MAEGIRIRPRPGVPVDDNGMIVVQDHARPFPPPRSGRSLEEVQPVCPVCKVQHFCKNYHIQLVAGSAIVSTTVWERLQGLAGNPFEMANVVPDPPAILVVPGDERGPVLVEKIVMPIQGSN